MLNTLVKKFASVALLGVIASVPFLSIGASTASATTSKLEITNTVDKQLADRGETLNYTFVVKNTGGVETTNTVVWTNPLNLAEIVPGSATYTRSTTGVTKALADTFVKDGGNFGVIPAGEKITFSLKTKVGQNANNDNIVWLVANAKSDQTPATVSTSAWTRVILKNPAVCGEVTADKTTVSKGDVINVTIKICNAGNIRLHNVRVGNYVHAPFTYVAGSTTLTLDGRVTKVTDSWINEGANVGDLNPGDETFLKFQLKVGNDLTDGQTIQHVAQIKSDETPNIIQCAIVFKGKVLGVTTTPPTELPNTGPGEVMLLVSGLVPAGLLIKKFKTRI